MCLGLLPETALAAEEESRNLTASLDVSQTGLDLTDAPEAETEYKAGAGKIIYTPATETAPAALILENAEISSGTPAIDQSGNYNEINGIILDHTVDYNIVLRGMNKFEHLYTAITSEGNDTIGRPSVTISGDGTLTLEDCRTGINAVDKLTLVGAKMTVDALEYGIINYGGLNILNGSDLQVQTKSTVADYSDVGWGLWYT